MSLKENLQSVKEELNSEEKLFESAVKTERFIKKYKNTLISGVVAVVVLAIGTALYDANAEAKREAANAAFTLLLNDPENTQAAAELEQIDPALYDAWKLSQALKNGDQAALKSLKKNKTLLVSDIAEYESAVLAGDDQALDQYALKQDAVYKDMALLQSAVLKMKAGKTDLARQKLKEIPADSPVYNLASTLMHYGIK